MINLQDSKIKARDRKAVRDEMERIRGQHAEGLLVPEEVVEAARAESSPLHPYFDWEDTSAAHRWRLIQARTLITSIEVYCADDPEEKAIPRYVSLIQDRGRDGGGYRPTSQVINSAELKAELKATLQKELDGILRRYELLGGLCEKIRKAAGIKAARKKK